ncbi:hypothetical protein ASE03_27900 [Kitasatospora sp. Root187]|nr:hypothetical protein ASC99_25275 [Kitasatospora sp. Root107]KRB69261.1 hypothetical protein ASE03_27900 [Kitasatospora sp. Root187]
MFAGGPVEQEDGVGFRYGGRAKAVEFAQQHPKAALVAGEDPARGPTAARLLAGESFVGADVQENEVQFTALPVNGAGKMTAYPGPAPAVMDQEVLT